MDSIGPQDLLIQPFIQLINRLINCLAFLVVTAFQSRTMTFDLTCLRAFLPMAEAAAGRGKEALVLHMESSSITAGCVIFRQTT